MNKSEILKIMNIYSEITFYNMKYWIMYEIHIIFKQYFMKILKLCIFWLSCFIILKLVNEVIYDVPLLEYDFSITYNKQLGTLSDKHFFFNLLSSQLRTSSKSGNQKGTFLPFQIGDLGHPGKHLFWEIN